MKNTKLISILLALFYATTAHPEMIASTQFEDWKKGEPTSMALFQEKGFQTGTWENSLKERTIIDTSYSFSGSQSMRIAYTKGGVGPEETGCQIQLKFAKRDEAYASYYLRFSENFTWGTTSYGGKLPGLSGGNCCSGGASCDGTNGFSARLMWRTGGKGVLYLYHMDKPETYGEDHDLIYPDGSPVIFERGKWYHVAERVRCNTNGDTYDGEVEIWIDGKQVLLRKGLRFTSNGDKVDDLYISTFHGGNDATWAPTETCHTWLDDIRIGTTYEDVAYQSCSKPQLGENKTLCTGAKSVSFSNKNDSEEAQYTWIYNGTVLSHDKQIHTWTPGEYILVLDSNWCSRRDTVELLSKQTPKPVSNAHICGQPTVTLHTHIEEGYPLSFTWEKDGIELKNRSNHLTISEAGTYKVTVSSPHCDSESATTNVTSGLIPVQKAASTDGTTPFTLEIEKSGNYAWYEDEQLTKEVGRGQTYTPADQQGSRLIYVKDLDGFSGHVGKPSLTSNAYTRSNFTTEWMLFTVYRELTIDTISIYPTKDLTGVIRILDDKTGETVFSQSYEGLKPGENKLPLQVTLSPGKYRMDANGTTAPLYHSHTDEDIRFPYAIDGLISLDGCNLAWINNKPWYLFFYNWKISAGNTCASTPVNIEDEQSTGLHTTNGLGFSIYPKFTDGDLFIEGLTSAAQVSIYSSTGKKMLSKKVKQANVHFSIAEWKHGTYLVKIQTSDWTRTFHILKF